MDRRSITFIVLSALGGVLFLLFWNKGDKKKHATDAGDGAPAVSVVDPRPEGIFEISAGTDAGADFAVRVSDVGGALKSVVLRKAQYAQVDRSAQCEGGARKSRWAEADRAACKEQHKAGPYEVVTTWDAGWHPFRITLLSVGWQGDGPAESMTRLVRDAGPVTVDPQNRYHVTLTRHAAARDLLLRPGDRLEGPGVPEDAVIKRVLSTDSLEASVPMPTPLPQTVRVVRVGSVVEQYGWDDRFVPLGTANGGTVRLVWPDPTRDASPLFIERTWTVDSSFLLNQQLVVHNRSSRRVVVRYRTEIHGWQDPDAEEPGMFDAHTKGWTPACYVDVKLQETAPKKLHEEAVEHSGRVSWFGLDSQYFLLAGVLRGEQGLPATCTLTATPDGVVTASLTPTADLELPGASVPCVPDGYPQRGPAWLPDAERRTLPLCTDLAKALGADLDKLSNVALKPLVDMAAGGDAAKRGQANQTKEALLAFGASRREAITYDVFAGPKDLGLLGQVGRGLDDTLDFWWFGFLGKPMLGFLKTLHGWVGNWALAIVFLTILVKLLLLPLTQSSFIQMQRMQKLKPEMDALRKKYEDDKPRFQQETMNLYKRHRVNPLGGCLPMVFQMPVYIALYRTISAAVDLFQAPLFLWIRDMTRPDPYFVLPVGLGVFMFVQQLLMPSPGTDAAQQKMIKYAMPVMFSLFMLFLPSGLVFYIFVSTILSIGQQYYIKKKYG